MGIVTSQAYKFHLLIEGIVAGRFVDASVLGAELDVIAYREGGDGQRTHHLPRAAKNSPLMLRYGVTTNSELRDWLNETSTEKLPGRRNFSLLLYGDDGTTEICRWNLFSTWPASYKAAALSAPSNNLLIDSVTFVYERVERD